MAALTSLLIGAAVASSAVGVIGQRKAEKDLKRDTARQLTKAEEAAKLKGIKEQDVRVKVGSDEDDETNGQNMYTKGSGTSNSGVGKRFNRVLPGSGSNVGGL